MVINRDIAWCDQINRYIDFPLVGPLQAIDLLQSRTKLRKRFDFYRSLRKIDLGYYYRTEQIDRAWEYVLNQKYNSFNTYEYPCCLPEYVIDYFFRRVVKPKWWWIYYEL